ncbi:branched-chain amino acid ABC transporter permease [Halalkaliarchaeum desulfuricum]|uniref:Branched-chain amino acid ABC transporter permease n=1 Tax=Halalkaliarchaeum desulfuricum TaxID=2055893 RepID=A0A343TIE3_9EURY|nr:branched-chain amino acid ABC transporter permease [Halalkaliarchaeum desulfuricum]
MWFAIVVIGVATFALRFSFIYLFGRVDEVPPRVRRALRFVPPAVLAALVAPALVTIDPDIGVVASLADERLAAGLVAAGVAWRTENLFLTIAVGMGALWLLRFGFGMGL